MVEPATTSALSTPWGAWLTELDERVLAAAEQGDEGLPVPWLLHSWAGERLGSAAIRMEGAGEGLTGPAPAEWRLVAHTPAAGALVLAVLDGRAPLRPGNVIAASFRARSRAPRGSAARQIESPPLVIGLRDAGVWAGELAIDPTPAATTGLALLVSSQHEAIDASVELIAGTLPQFSGPRDTLTLALELSLSLALSLLGGSLDQGKDDFVARRA